MQFKIFSSYFLKIDEKTHFICVISRKRNEEIIIKPALRANCTYYRLYQNGIKAEYSLKQLVELAIPLIKFI